jgi:sigma-B regulation protein RsbU (phosphoserine phosphatase)
MAGLDTTFIKNQLVDRRERLNHIIPHTNNAPNLLNLLKEVDSALERIDNGTYGLCEVCHDPIEPERLLADPLTRFCLGDLTELQQRTLEQDLTLASQIQRGLLPKNDLSIDGWEFSYHYSPSGSVSGDYCDLIPFQDNTFLFALGDVSGKGVSASLLMSHMHALFHSMISFGLEIGEIVEKSNRLFCESAMSTHYATLVCGKANPSGEIEICNAGHNYPLHITDGKISRVESTGLPIGLFGNSEYGVNEFKLSKGDTLVLYSDGLTESSFENTEYGEKRLENLMTQLIGLPANAIINEIIKDQRSFLKSASPSDDVTLMVIKKL